MRKIDDGDTHLQAINYNAQSNEQVHFNININSCWPNRDHTINKSTVYCTMWRYSSVFLRGFCLSLSHRAQHLISIQSNQSHLLLLVFRYIFAGIGTTATAIEFYFQLFSPRYFLWCSTIKSIHHRSGTNSTRSWRDQCFIGVYYYYYCGSLAHALSQKFASISPRAKKAKIRIDRFFVYDFSLLQVLLLNYILLHT